MPPPNPDSNSDPDPVTTPMVNVDTDAEDGVSVEEPEEGSADPQTGGNGEEEPDYIEKEYVPYDGWYNNRAHPEWGVVGASHTNCV